MNPKSSTTKVEQRGLANVLKAHKLRVPQNQREYSWEEKEVTTLLQDLATAIKNGDSEYFLGTVVAVGIGGNELEIVDGQQRLATTAIFLTAVKDFLSSTEKEIAASIDTEYLTSATKDRRGREPRIVLNVSDNEFFRRTMAGETAKPERSSHERIVNAFKFAKSQVRNIVAPYDAKEHGDILNGWVTFLDERAQVVLLTIPSDANAYRMFETLNDRGLKTTQADLVKNYMFGRSADRLGESQEKWASMRGALDSLDEDEVPTVTYLRHAIMLKRGYFREADLYDQVQLAAKNTAQVVSLLDQLDLLAPDYVATFNSESEKWASYPDAIKDAIRPLNLLNIKPMRPLMLAVAANFSEKEAAHAFRKFISWQVRFLIAGSTLSGGSIEVPLANAAKKVFDKLIASEKSLTTELVSVIPNDEQFKQAFSNATVSKPALARYYLRSLETAHKGEPDPWFIPNADRETITLEHVLPLRPEGNWSQFEAAISKADAKRLGNLVLLRAKQNSDLKSAPFSEKRKIYKDVPYDLTSRVAAVPEWTHEAIVTRQSELALLALKAWPL